MPDFQAQTEVREDDPLEARRVAAVLAAVEAGDAARLTDLLAPLHAADIADLLEQMGAGDRHALLHLWSGEIDGEILSEIDESIREEVIDHLPRDVLHQAVRELDTDDVVDILEDLEAPQRQQILTALEDVDRVAVEQAMAYPEGSAGRLMQREVVVAPELDGRRGHRFPAPRQAPARPVLSYHPGRSPDEADRLCHPWPPVVGPTRRAAARSD